MKTLQLDLRHSLRLLRNDPGYGVVAILLFALGIGANTALFSVANSVLFRPLPYAHPEQLVVTLHEGNFPVSPADYLDYKSSVHAFAQTGAAQLWGGNLTGGDRPEQIPGMRITANMIQLLGVSPMLGRSFNPEEAHAAQANVVLLSYGLWQRRFGGDRQIVGRQISVDQTPYTVLGVMPPGFRFAPFWATRAQMWSPLMLDSRLQDRGGRSLRVFARLKPGVSIAQAQSHMDAVARHLAELYPQTNAKLGITVVPLHEKVVRSVRPTLLVTLGTVGFVLLIACATVSNLILARAVSRRKEMALRLVVGAQLLDLVRVTLLDVLVLALLGGFGGVLLAGWVVDSLRVALPPGSVPRLSELRFDGSALVFAGIMFLFSALLTGFIPAIEAIRADLNTDLKGASRGSTHGSGRSRSRSTLIAVEVGLSLVLMAGAGLMLRTMFALRAIDAGFNPHNLVTMQVAINGTDYNQAGRRANLFREVRDRLAFIPGVESVSAINHLPIGGDIWRLRYSVAGHAKPAPGEETSAVYRVVMPGYFHTMQIRLLRGRDFDAHDKERSLPLAIINETMAKRCWPGEAAIGKVIYYPESENERDAAHTIVAVVRDARQNDWTSPASEEVYLPYYQRPDSMGLSYMTFVLRTRANANALADAALQSIGELDKSLPVSEVATMDRVISDELWRQRLATTLIGAFAAVALLLAAVGIFGVISHSMRQRAQEIGVRIALGATRKDLIYLAVCEGMQPVVLGAIAGLLSGLGLTRFMQTLLFGVKPEDPIVFIGILSLLLAVCITANLIPALRLTSVDPLLVLRHEQGVQDAAACYIPEREPRKQIRCILCDISNLRCRWLIKASFSKVKR